MKPLPCPRCGSAKTLGTFCADCLREVHPLVREIKPAKLTLCASCGSAKLAGVWKATSLANAVGKAASVSLAFASDVEVSGVEFADPEIVQKPGVRKTTTVLAIVTGHHEDAPADYEEEYDVTLQYEVTYCPRCAKDARSYEGILQIRNETPAVAEEVREYVKARAVKGLRVAKRAPIGTGTDYYLSDHRLVAQLAQRLHAQRGGELKINAQHFSEDAQAGKILYRVNAFLELPDYTKGDVILRDGKHLYVLGVSRKVKAEDLATGAEIVFPYVRGDATILPIRTTQVTRAQPVEVFHPVTYQSVRPANSKYAPAEPDIDRPVSVAVDGALVFLIPDTPEKEPAMRVKRRVSQKRG